MPYMRWDEEEQVFVLSMPGPPPKGVVKFGLYFQDEKGLKKCQWEWDEEGKCWNLLQDK